MTRSMKAARKCTSPRPKAKSYTEDFVLTGSYNQKLCRPHSELTEWLSVHRLALHQPRTPKSDDPGIFWPLNEASTIYYRCVWAGLRLKRRSVLIPRVLASHHWTFVLIHKPIARTCSSSRTKQDYHCNNNLFEAFVWGICCSHWSSTIVFIEGSDRTLFEVAQSNIYCVNDPSAGSPTETLLRLLLPLNGQVWLSSQRR